MRSLRLGLENWMVEHLKIIGRMPIANEELVRISNFESGILIRLFDEEWSPF